MYPSKGRETYEFTPGVVSQIPCFPGSLYRIVTPDGEVIVLTFAGLFGICLFVNDCEGMKLEATPAKSSNAKQRIFLMKTMVMWVERIQGQERNGKGIWPKQFQVFGSSKVRSSMPRAKRGWYSTVKQRIGWDCGWVDASADGSTFPKQAGRDTHPRSGPISLFFRISSELSGFLTGRARLIYKQVLFE